jgi:membrane protein YdbS with pleckstrin-like domain
LSRRTDIVERGKLQSIDRVQGWLLRRYGLGRVVVRFAGGAVGLPLVTWEDAAAIQDQLLFGLVHRGEVRAATDAPIVTAVEAGPALAEPSIG